MQLLVAPVYIKALLSIFVFGFLTAIGNVVPLFWMLLIMHTWSGGSNVLRYYVGSYCFSSQADLHSSTSRLYMSTTSSMSINSHLICDINSSVFSSSAGFSLFLSLSRGASSVAVLFSKRGFLNCL